MWSRLVPKSILGRLIVVVVAAVLMVNTITMLVLLQFVPDLPRRVFFPPPTILLLPMVALLLWLVIARWIAKPLTSLAAAARSFGRSPSSVSPLPEDGPSEVAEVWRSFNEMRGHIRELMETRTRMLVALSHDVRTPLTRLRLWTEQLPDVRSRTGMLHEIERIDGMLRETLVFLQNDSRSEPRVPTDLGSLLQTICAEFADVGHEVAYFGPAHFVQTCRPTALQRGISNIVDNAVRFGTRTEVHLRVEASEVRICICDDGPGVPEEFRDKIFEPFYRGENERPRGEHRGFGLGLSIARNTILAHGGAIEVKGRTPAGLSVEISLPRVADSIRPD